LAPRPEDAYFSLNTQCSSTTYPCTPLFVSNTHLEVQNNGGLGLWFHLPNGAGFNIWGTWNNNGATGMNPNLANELKRISA
jgi:hypothetical protein